MTITKLLVIVAVCLVLCLVIGVAVTPAEAAKPAKKDGDKNLASRQGVGGALQTNATEDEGDSKGPSKLQMAVGVGSIFVMIAVVKWL